MKNAVPKKAVAYLDNYLKWIELLKKIVLNNASAKIKDKYYVTLVYWPGNKVKVWNKEYYYWGRTVWIKEEVAIKDVVRNKVHNIIKEFDRYFSRNYENN